MTFGRLAGCAVAAGRGAQGRKSVAACPAGAAAFAGLPRQMIARAVATAWPDARLASLRPLVADAPYAKAEGVETGTLEARLTGPGPARVFIDPGNGRILVAMDRSREAYAWLYYMAHTYNYPGLSDRPTLRIALLLVPLTLGFLFALTGVVAGVRRALGSRRARPS